MTQLKTNLFDVLTSLLIVAGMTASLVGGL